MNSFKYHVFLSHNSTDKPDVEELAVRLRREGLEPWLDKWNLIPGQECQPAMEQALADCATCAVFIGPGGPGPWQNEELRAAIDRRVGEKGGQFRVIPVLLPGTERPGRGKLPLFLTATTWVEFRRSLDDEEAFRRLVCGIRGEEPGPGPGGAPSKAVPPGPGPGSALEGVPYRGLEVFDVEHAGFFFGREALTEWLVVALRPTPGGQENRFLAILGASGSGKSSLARAGLVASLKRGALDGSGDWPIVILKPGRNPTESLALALAALPDGASLIKDTRDLLNIKAFGDDQKSLHYFARLALRAAPPSRRLVVLVDQSEEVFTLCKDETAHQALFDNLLYAATVAGGQAIVVLTMRADFYGKCGLYPALAAAMSDHQLLVGPMTEDELRRAIERPALQAGGEFEPGLVEMLLQEVAGQPGSLPLLQFTLMELWQRREGRRLTVAAYRAIGELQGALKNRADNVFGQFDDAQRDLCRRIFLRLTQPGEGIEDTKRRASFGELIPAGADPGAVEAVVRRLTDARLITTEGDPKKAGAVSVEVAHEALVRGWGRLRAWIDADRAGLRTHHQLAEAARDWEAHGRESSFLFVGTRLAVAREWATTRRDELNALEAEFLAASRRKRLKLKLARAASILVPMALALWGWEWSQWQKWNRLDKLSQTVDKNVEKARQRARETHWPEAIEVLEGTLSWLEPGAEYESLRRRVTSPLEWYKKRKEEQEAQEEKRKARQRDGDFVVALNENRLAWPPFAKYKSNSVISVYKQKFSEYGIDIDALQPERTADLIRGIRAKPQEVREAMALALDDWAWRANSADGFDLRLMSSLNDVSGIPTAGKNLIIVAAVDNVLHFRIFDGDGKVVVDTDEKRLTEQARQIEALRMQLESLRPPNELSRSDKGPVITAITSIVGHTPADGPRLWNVARELDSDPQRNAIRDAMANRDTSALRRLASGPDVTNYPVATLLQLAWALMQPRELGTDRFIDVVALLQRAQPLHPDEFWINYILASALSFAVPAQNDEAIRYFAAAIALRPAHPTPHAGLGRALRNKGRIDGAIIEYDKAIDLDHECAWAHCGRGDAWCDKKGYDKAFADYDKAIRLNPDPKFAAQVYNGRGNAWYDKKEYDKAFADYNEAIHLDPTYATAYHSRGNAWYDKKEYDKAFADYDKAIHLDPKDAMAYKQLASLWATCPDEKYHDGKKAIESATRACVLTDWKDANYLDTLASACAEAGDFGEAVKWLGWALGLLSKDDELKRNDFGDRLTLYQAKKPTIRSRTLSSPATDRPGQSGRDRPQGGY
ncbi:MAG: tetratricopeptide repeat protein [Planctomycetaceae bacterium]|nr:tetratricopeptide repeat protein [Planctomycetaceae bacterium]